MTIIYLLSNLFLFSVAYCRKLLLYTARITSSLPTNCMPLKTSDSGAAVPLEAPHCSPDANNRLETTCGSAVACKEWLYTQLQNSALNLLQNSTLEVVPTTLEQHFAPMTANFNLWPWPSNLVTYYPDIETDLHIADGLLHYCTWTTKVVRTKTKI